MAFIELLLRICILIPAAIISIFITLGLIGCITEIF